MAAKADLPAIRTNADWRLRLILKADSAGTPYDLTGCELRLGLRLVGRDGAPAHLLTTERGGLAVTDAAGGEVRIQMPHADVRGMEPGTYDYDLTIVRADGAYITALYGTVPVEQGIG